MGVGRRRRRGRGASLTRMNTVIGLGLISVVSARCRQDPLNSDDDISEADPEELFETDNVVVCQFDKVSAAQRSAFSTEFTCGVLGQF